MNIVSTLREIGRLVTELADFFDVDNVVSSSDEPASLSTEPEEEKTYTYEEVRARLSHLSRKGFTAKMREILSQYGAAKLSDVDPKNYTAIMKAAEEIDNA